MRVEVPTKYTKVTFNEDFYDGQECRYATVEFAWGDKADKKAVAFSILMDKRILDKAHEILCPIMGIEGKDIYLEDTWLMVNIPSAAVKHHTAHLIGIVTALEAVFDEMVG
jgi:hypothetical protein